jgi:Ca2+-binding EF-hand superfamily protein
MTAAFIWAAPFDERFPISVEDLEARSADTFARVDGNDDGLISAEEFFAQESMALRVRPGFHHGKGEHSTDGDRPPNGRHPRATRHSGATRIDYMENMDDELFAALDTDMDGTLSSSEFSTTAMAEARGAIMKQRMFERLDANDDTMLTPDEFPPQRLSGLDANSDGLITREEMRDGRSRHHSDAE